MTQAISSPLLTTEEAAAYLGLKPSTLTTWRSTRQVEIPYIRTGVRRVRYRKADLDAWLEQQRVSPEASDARSP